MGRGCVYPNSVYTKGIETNNNEREKMTIKQLKEAIKQMTINDESWDVIDMSMDILEKSISEKEFLLFCEEVEELV